MILNKYSKAKDGKTVVGSFADRSSSASSASSATSPSSSKTDRIIWGQSDTGDDIDGDMLIDGNVFVGDVGYDDKDNPIEPEHEFPSESGNAYYAKSVESPSVFGHSLYLNLDGVKTNLLDILMPVGSVIMFKGNAPIPQNWAICDGSNGTPDLRGKFIKGVADIKEAGKTGGSETVTLGNIIPKHTHKFYNYLTQVHENKEIFDSASKGEIKINGKTVEVGSHSKTRDPTYRAQTENSGYSDMPYILHETEPAGSDSAETSEANIEPPFYTLVFIMRIK